MLHQVFVARRRFAPLRHALFVSKGDEIKIIKVEKDVMHFDFNDDKLNMEKTMFVPEKLTLSEEELAEYFTKKEEV